MPNASQSTQPSLEGALISWMEEFAPYGIITTDRELNIRSWNRWVAQKSGIAPEAVIGRHLFKAFPELKDRHLSGRFERALLGEVSVVSTALHGYLLPMPSPVPEASYQHMQQTARIGPLSIGKDIQGLIIILEDVTHRELQAATLRKQHEREQLLSWALGHLVRLKNPARSVRELFYRIAESYDYDGYFLYLRNEANVLWLSSAGGITPETRAAVSSLDAPERPWKTLFSPIPVVMNSLGESRDPSEQWPRTLGIKAYLVLPLVVGDSSLGVLCFSSRSRDDIPQEEIELLVTISQYLAIALHREQTDDQLRNAQKSLREHASELEKKVAERTRRLREMISELETFSYSLAHDLRAPIRAITGYCDVLFEDYGNVIPDEPREIIERLSRACLKLDTLTRDLLEFSKVSREEIRLTTVSIGEVVGDILAISPPKYKEIVQTTGPMLSVQAHPGLLQRCLQNLLENAMKFVAPGTSPNVCIRSELITRNSAMEERPSLALPFTSAVFADGKQGPNPEAESEKDAWVRIWVEDRGIGIPPGAQEKIFGIFERGTSSENFGGTGIGLAIVARAMERMNGRCGVQPRPGGGSSFWLELQKG